MSEPMLDPQEPSVRDRLLEVADGLHEHLSKHISFEVVDKDTDLLMDLIAQGLDKARMVKDLARTLRVDIPLNAPTGAAFKANYATTIGRRVCMPPRWLARTADGACERLIVEPHEVTHVHQFERGVKAGWWPAITTHSVLYLAGIIAHTKDGEEYVGKVEGDAYAVSAYARKFLCGVPHPLEWCLENIRSAYNLANVGPMMAEDILRSHYATMSAGATPPVEILRVTRDYFYAHAGDLRGRVIL